MVIRLATVTTLIALFALSFSAMLDFTRQRSFASPTLEARQDCLAGGLLCAPGATPVAN